jgi:hypothetical protein
MGRRRSHFRRIDTQSCRASGPVCIVLASGTSGTSSSVHCGDSAFGMVTAAALTQRLMRAGSCRKRLRRFRARRSARLTAAGRRRSIGLFAVWPPWAFRLFGSAALRLYYWYCFLFRPRQGGSRPHISEGSEFSELYAAWRRAASRDAPNLKRADSILRSKMPFTC